MKSGRSDPSDYDWFAVGPQPWWGLYRITAALARAAELAQRGKRLTPSGVFDLSDLDLPHGAITEDALPKAWTGLERCGFDRAPVSAIIDDVIKRADWSLDPWNADNAARAEQRETAEQEAKCREDRAAPDQQQSSPGQRGPPAGDIHAVKTDRADRAQAALTLASGARETGAGPSERAARKRRAR